MPVLSGSDSISIPTLMPGQTLFGTWKKGDGNSSSHGFAGDSMREYFELIDTLVEVIEGENLGVSVTVKPIKSHVSKVIRTYYKEEDINIDMGDPVDMTTGAFTDSIDVLSLSGKNTLEYVLSYNSVMACDEDIDVVNNPLGKGWTGSFSSFVKEESGLIKYYTTPYVFNAFIAEDSYNGKVYGSVEDKKSTGENATSTDAEINLSSMSDRKEDIRFVSVTHGMEGYVLTRHSDGTYDLESPVHQILNYDTSGRLVKITMEDGSVTTLEYTEHQIHIKDTLSGNSIIIDKNDDGQIVKISDGDSRSTSFTYSNGNIAQITDSLGQTTYYEYDEKNRIISEKNNSDIEFVKNEYDSEGRVLKQNDSYGKSIEFSYTDLDDGGTECVAVTKASGYEDVTKKVITDIQGKVTEIENESGSKEKYTYDKYGNVSSHTDGYGNTTKLSYDKDGKLLKSSGIFCQSIWR